MATVALPFQAVDETQQDAKKIPLREGLQGRLILYLESGDHYVSLDGKREFGPASDTAALIFFNRILNPSKPVQETIQVAPAPEKEEKRYNTHLCPCCHKDVSDERLEMTGTPLCVDCTPPQPPIYGVMSYAEKAGGILMTTTDPKIFRLLKKPINQQR